MRLKSPILFLTIAFLFSGCRKTEVREPEGCINLSEIEAKQDYYLPFALKNDLQGTHLIIINNDTVNCEYGKHIIFRQNGFYEMVLVYEDEMRVNDTILYTTKTEERENSEWGIKAWIPLQYQPEYLETEEIEVIYPRQYTSLIKVPFIFLIKENGSVKHVNCHGMSSSSAKFGLRQGVGSVNIAASKIEDEMHFVVGTKSAGATLTRVTRTDMELKGIISSPVIIPANSLVRIAGDLEITSTGSLTVNEGAVILIDEAINILADGPVVFAGTAVNPVLVTCSLSDKYWGGFITKEPTGTIEAKYAIFCQSGYHDSDEYAWGHAGRQALFYSENSELTLEDCFITDHIGQIFYPKNSTLTLNRILVQRAKTGGQINYSDLSLTNSFFIDFPDDDYIFNDDDNDALYLIATNAVIDNTMFMFAKDDGLDSGGEEGGDVNVTRCRFEACFHEGAALSSGGEVIKNHTFTDCVFINCGQGIELGFSSPNHTVTVDNCIFQANGTGIRYGDNYTWSKPEGKMYVRNSFSLNNDRDVWNMVRKLWGPRLENMSFENVVVSQFCPQYPGLTINN